MGTEAVKLSLDIMLTVRAFAVLGAGAALLEPILRGFRGLTGVFDQGRGTGWITQEPVRSHDLPRERTVRHAVPKRARPSGTDPSRWERIQDSRVELSAEAIRLRVWGMGSRSAFIVLLTLGNSVREDPGEEREASYQQNCPWETPRAHWSR